MKETKKTVVYKEKVLETIKGDIIALKFPSGTILNERKLANDLDVSRTPVREAIQMLEREGWVEVIPWRGAIVKSVTIDDIEETFQLRMAIESLVIELIIHQLGDEELSRLDQLWQDQLRLSEERNAVDFIMVDQDFHLFLAELTGNRRLYQFMRQLRDTHLRLGVAAIQSETRFEGTLEEHQEIIDALKKKQYLKARQSMMDHLLNTRRSLIRHIKESEKGESNNED